MVYCVLHSLAIRKPSVFLPRSAHARGKGEEKGKAKKNTDGLRNYVSHAFIPHSEQRDTRNRQCACIQCHMYRIAGIFQGGGGEFSGKSKFRLFHGKNFVVEE